MAINLVKTACLLFKIDASRSLANERTSWATRQVHSLCQMGMTISSITTVAMSNLAVGTMSSSIAEVFNRTRLAESALTLSVIRRLPRLKVPRLLSA